jgi:drug/metabolite transporter (DMT)-like permease
MSKAFFIVLTAICFSVSGELMLKSGMNSVGVLSLSNFWATFGRILSHPRILGGFGLVGIGALFWLSAISRAPLSWAYPMLSIGYLLILLFSAIILKEQVTPMRWVGALIICVGIVLVFRSGNPR